MIQTVVAPPKSEPRKKVSKKLQACINYLKQHPEARKMSSRQLADTVKEPSAGKSTWATALTSEK